MRWHNRAHHQWSYSNEIFFLYLPLVNIAARNKKHISIFKRRKSAFTFFPHHGADHYGGTAPRHEQRVIPTRLFCQNPAPGSLFAGANPQVDGVAGFNRQSRPDRLGNPRCSTVRTAELFLYQKHENHPGFFARDCQNNTSAWRTASGSGRHGEVPTGHFES